VSSLRSPPNLFAPAWPPRRDSAHRAIGGQPREFLKARPPPLTFPQGEAPSGGDEHLASARKPVRRGDRRRPGVRHARRSRDVQASRRACGRHIPFLQRRLPRQVHRRSRKIPDQAGVPGARHGAGGDDLHLPDAPGDPPAETRQLPDLRDGVGARDSVRGGGTQSRAGRHDAALLDRRRLRAAPVRARDGRPHPRARAASFGAAAPRRLDRARAREPGGAGVRVAVF